MRTSKSISLLRQCSKVHQNYNFLSTTAKFGDVPWKCLANDIIALQKLTTQENWPQQLTNIELSLRNEKTWGDIKKFGEMNQQRANLMNRLAVIEEFVSTLGEISHFHEVGISDHDELLLKECDDMLVVLSTKVQIFKTDIMFIDEIDSEDCVVQINAGVGGLDSCDWTGMLYSMYKAWSSQYGFGICVMDESRDNDADQLGFRSITFKLSGFRAYGWFKAEAGVHRLVRISPYDPKERRHTSFAQVQVYPCVTESPTASHSHSDILHPDDLRIETKRASGAGGQHVNRTNSAVRITHVPSGLVINCQNERSQHQNKAYAMTILRAKVRKWQQDAKNKSIQALTIGNEGDNSWSHQIRSLVLQPYQLVKDHRCQWESGNTSAYLRGELLHDCMTRYLQHRMGASSSPGDPHNGE